MNTKTTILGLLAVIAIVMGGIGFALAQDDTVTDDTTVCTGNGVLGLLNSKGFWSQLSEDQRTQLATLTQEMFELGASQDEIRAMKAEMLQEWGIDAPQWSGPHAGSHGGHGQMLRDGSGAGSQYGGRRNGNRGGNGYNGDCPN